MIRLENVSVKYGELSVLENFSLEVRDGEILCLLGDSGCGKTTVLNAVGGVAASTGTVSGVPERVSYVFQRERLLPHLTVRGNLEYVLRGALPAAEREQAIRAALSGVELTDWADRYPEELSGGMSQRAAIARAFAYPSGLLLLDEPFRALDMALKRRVIQVFLNVWREERRTVLFVTHDIDEALLLASRIVLLSGPPLTQLAELTVPGEQNGRRLADPELGALRAKIYETFGL